MAVQEAQVIEESVEDILVSLGERTGCRRNARP